MTYVANRRSFLRATLGTAAGVSLAQWRPEPAAARERPAPLAASRLNDHLVMISGAGANVVAASAAEGALLVDGGTQERSSELLKLALKETSARRVTTLFNTHWHPEQTGSNERLGKDGAKIISHENTRLWLGYANPVAWENRTYGPLPPKARPNDTTFDSGKVTHGSESIEYGYLLQAHTDGDIFVHFRDSNVLVTGGAVSGAGWPVVDYETGGWIGGLVDGLKTLITRADGDTRIVPANGPLLKRADLEAQHAMYATVFDRLGKLLRKGLAPDEVVAAAPTKEFDAQWGESTQFVTMAFKSLWGHFAPDA